jgi:predicted phage terminase large subunit-like protein
LLLLLEEKRRRATAQQIEEDRAACVTFKEFVKRAWPIIEPGHPLSWSFYIQAVCDHLQAVSDGKIRKLIINIPPRTGKSNIVSVLWPVWEWTRNPTLRMVLATYNLQKLSLPLSGKRRDLIVSEWFQDRWGDKVKLSKDQREKSDFKNTVQGQMFCTSTGAVLTGRGGMRLILDDPQDPEAAESEVQRQGTIEWLCATWPSRKDNPDAAEVLVQQRLHEDDATGLFIKQGGWVRLKIPMQYAGEPNVTQLGYRDPRRTEGEVLDPRRFPPYHLEDLKRRMSDYSIAGQLQQEPAPRGGAWIKRAWLHEWKYSDTQTGYMSIMDGQYEFDPWKTFRFCTVDPAVTSKELVGGETKKKLTDPDYTVIAAWVCFATTRGPALLLVDLIRARMEGPDIVPAIQAMHREWKFAVIGIESVAFQQVLVQQARRLGLPVREISTKNEEEGMDAPLFRIDKDKAARILASTPFMKDGRFFIPVYTTWREEYVTELTRYPNTSHDDQADCTAMGIAVAEKYRGEGIPDMYNRPNQNQGVHSVDAPSRANQDRPKDKLEGWDYTNRSGRDPLDGF